MAGISADRRNPYELLELFVAETVTYSNQQQWLVGGFKHVLFFNMLGIIIPTDFHIFQRG